MRFDLNSGQTGAVKLRLDPVGPPWRGEGMPRGKARRTRGEQEENTRRTRGHLPCAWLAGGLSVACRWLWPAFALSARAGWPAVQAGRARERQTSRPSATPFPCDRSLTWPSCPDRLLDRLDRVGGRRQPPRIPARASAGRSTGHPPQIPHPGSARACAGTCHALGWSVKILMSMKTAYELAMERLGKTSPTVKLTNEQKKEIAELESKYAAKLAERELFLKGEIVKAIDKGDAQAGNNWRSNCSATANRCGPTLRRRRRKCATRPNRSPPCGFDSSWQPAKDPQAGGISPPGGPPMPLPPRSNERITRAGHRAALAEAGARLISLVCYALPAFKDLTNGRTDFPAAG